MTNRHYVLKIEDRLYVGTGRPLSACRVGINEARVFTSLPAANSAARAYMKVRNEDVRVTPARVFEAN